MSQTSAQLLLVEDNPGDVRLITEYLRAAERTDPFILTVAGRLDEALRLLDTQWFDVILLDLALPDAHDLDTLKALAARIFTTPLIVISGLSDTTMAVEAMRTGAQDYLVKSLLTAEMLMRSIRNAIERAKIRNQLLETESQYRLLAENITDVITRHAPDSTIRYVSPSCRMLLGYGPEEMIGSKTDKFFHPDDLHILNRVRELSRRTVNSYTITYRIRHKNGSYIWFETTGNVTRDPATQTVLETISVSRDITERYNAEETTRLLQKAIEQTDDALIVMTAESELAEARIVFVNPAFSRLTGYPPESLIGRQRRILQDHLSDPDMSKQVHEALARGDSFRGESINHRRDGREYEVEWNIAPIRDTSGKITHYVCAQRDVTKRHREERALLESETRFKAIAEALPVAIAITHLSDSTIFYSNDRYCDVMGLPRGTATGQKAVSFFHNPQDRQQFVDEIKQTGAASAREVQIQRPDGTLRWVLVAVSSITLDGEAALLSGFHDITHIKELEREQALLAAIVESSEDAIIGKTLDGVILSWNRGAERLYGYQPHEVVGQSFQMLVPPDRTAENLALLMRIAQGDHIALYETVHVTKSGKQVDISLAISPIQTPDGAIVGAATIARDITERKQADRELIASEDRFHTLFENSPISLWEQDYSETKRSLDKLHAQGITDFETYFEQHPQALQECIRGVQVLDVNQATLALYRAPDKRRLLQDVPQPPLDSMVAGTRRFLAAIGAGKTSYQTEFVNRTLEGDLIDIDVTWTVVPGFEKTFAKVIRSVVDITERKRAERTLREYSQRIEILHKIDGAILAAQSSQRVAQAVVEALSGLLPCDVVRVVSIDSKDESITQLAAYPPGSEISLDSLRKVVRNYGLPEALLRGETFAFDDVQMLNALPQDIATMLTSSGGRSGIIVPLIAGDQLLGVFDAISAQPSAFTPAHLDIAREVADQLAIALQKSLLDEQIQEHAHVLESRVAERTVQLRYAKERSEAILLGTSDAMIVATLDGSVEQFNPAFTTLFGYSLEDDRPVSLFSLVDSVSADLLHQTIAEIVAGSKTRRVELVCERRDETVFDADVAFAQVVDSDPLTLICSVRDITLYKQAQENLRQALAKERELGELKTRFVSTVSHEFRTPLSTILTSSDLMKHYEDRMSSEKKLEHLERIQIQVRHLTDLLEDVLFMSRAETAGVQLNLTLIDFEAFCRSLVDEMQLTAPTHTLHFVSTAPGLTMQFDAKLMRQVVANLLSNAIKYSPTGSVIQIDLLREPSQAVLRVKDAGIGIPDEDQARLFELFHRAGNVGTTPGTGLGLTIVKRAVEAHQGTVAVESKVGIGTTFTVSLPVT